MEIPAEVKSIAGPTTLCLCLTKGKFVVPFLCELHDIVARDPYACRHWLEQTVNGKIVFCVIHNKISGTYIASVFFDGIDIGEALVAQGLADQ